MNKSTVILIAAAVLLTGLYAYYFSDWFGGETIHIIAQIRPGAGRNANGADPVSFMLDKKYKLTRVQVMAVDAGQSAEVVPVWSLISDSNSVPTKALTFGGEIPGMRPAITGVVAKPLVPNKSYRIALEARGVKGEVTFKAQGKAPAPATNSTAAPLPPPLPR